MEVNGQWIPTPAIFFALAAVFVAARAAYEAIIRSDEEWSRSHPDQSQAFETAVGLAVAGFALSGVGAIAWSVLSSAESTGWVVLSRIATIAGLVGGLAAAYSASQKTHAAPPGSRPGAVAVVLPGTHVVGRASPRSLTMTWVVEQVDASKVVLRSQTGLGTSELARPVFEASIASGTLTVK